MARSSTGSRNKLKRSEISIRAEQIRSLGPRRSAGAISGWRFPRDLAGYLRALRGDRCADTARRTEILERRSTGSLRRPERGAGAAFSGCIEDAGLMMRAKFHLARPE